VALYEQLASVAKALANAKRLGLIELLVRARALSSSSLRRPGCA
jgi:hypothetical protein